MQRREPQQYLKIANYLTTEIREGRLPVGDYLPSELELCEKFHTSRGPVRQAMAKLRSEGKISSGRGRRSVVLGNFTAESFEAGYSLSARYEAQGLNLDQKILWIARRPAYPEVAEALNVQEGDPIVYIHRIRSSEGKNRVIQQHYFPLEIGRHLLDYDEDDGSLHKVLARAGVRIDNLNRVLNMAPASAEDAEVLNVEEGWPIHISRQYLHNHSGDPVEFSIFKYVGDRVQMSISTVRGGYSPLRLSITNSPFKN